MPLPSPPYRPLVAVGSEINNQQNNGRNSGEEEGKQEMENAGREASPSPCWLAHVNQPGQLGSYQKLLCKLMMFVNNKSYPVGHTSSNQELLSLKP
eukprot:13053503-Ditylum_brightwellii.AAC.1